MEENKDLTVEIPPPYVAYFVLPLMFVVAIIIHCITLHCDNVPDRCPTCGAKRMRLKTAKHKSDAITAAASRAKATQNKRDDDDDDTPCFY